MSETTESVQEEDVSFAIILAEAEAGDQEEQVRSTFSEAFRIEEDQVQKILDRTPIVFLKDMQRDEVSSIKPKLKELSENGLTFRITSAGTGSLPEVIWPEEWSYKPSYEGELIRKLHFDFHGNALVCPECGETLMLKRTGKQLPKTKHTPEVIQKPVEKRKKTKGKEDKQQKRTEKEEETEEPEVEKPPPEPTPTENQETEPDSGLELEEDEPEEEEEDFEDIPPLELEEDEEEEEAVDQSRDPEIVELTEDEGDCNLFLQPVSDDENLNDVISLLAEIRNCSEDEAEDLTNRPIIPVIKGVTEESAEELLSRFKDLGAGGNITRKN